MLSRPSSTSLLIVDRNFKVVQTLKVHTVSFKYINNILYSVYYIYILYIILNVEQIKDEWFHFQLIQVKISHASQDPKFNICFFLLWVKYFCYKSISNK